MYRLDSYLKGQIAVGFAPTVVPLTAYSLWRHDEADELRKTPIIGFIIVHDVNEDGEVTDGEVRPAVWHEEYQTAETALNYFAECTNEVLVVIGLDDSAVNDQNVAYATAELDRRAAQ